MKRLLKKSRKQRTSGGCQAGVKSVIHDHDARASMFACAEMNESIGRQRLVAQLECLRLK